MWPLQNCRELWRGVTTLLYPIRNLVVPDQRVSADDHVVTLGKRHQLVGAVEIVWVRIAIGPRMNGAELHFVLSLQLS